MTSQSRLRAAAIVLLTLLAFATPSFAGKPEGTCCVCGLCGQNVNATSSLDNAICLAYSTEGECKSDCFAAGCAVADIAKTPCTAPELADVCRAEMAPAASPLGTAALAVLLVSIGAFVLSRRRA